MSKSTVSVEAQAPAKFDVKTLDFKTKAPALVVAETQGADALKGRLSCRTHAIHVVLACAEAPLTTKIISERASALMGRACNATASHLNTMKTRKFVERVNNAWALTSDGRELCGAPVKKKKGAKKSAK